MSAYDDVLIPVTIDGRISSRTDKSLGDMNHLRVFPRSADSTAIQLRAEAWEGNSKARRQVLLMAFLPLDKVKALHRQLGEIIAANEAPWCIEGVER